MGAQPELTLTFSQSCSRLNTRCGPTGLRRVTRSALVGWGVGTATPAARSSPQHEDVADAATEVGVAGVGQASQVELLGLLSAGLGPGECPLVGLHLLKLIVHIEPDPAGESSVSPALPHPSAALPPPCPWTAPPEARWARLTPCRYSRKPRNGGHHRQSSLESSPLSSAAGVSHGPVPGTPGTARSGDSGQVSGPGWDAYSHPPAPGAPHTLLLLGAGAHAPGMLCGRADRCPGCCGSRSRSRCGPWREGHQGASGSGSHRRGKSWPVPPTGGGP